MEKRKIEKVRIGRLALVVDLDGGGCDKCFFKGECLDVFRILCIDARANGAGVYWESRGDE